MPTKTMQFNVFRENSDGQYEDDPIQTFSTELLDAVPEATFSVARHHGGGSYQVRYVLTPATDDDDQSEQPFEDGEAVYELTMGFVEPDTTE